MSGPAPGPPGILAGMKECGGVLEDLAAVVGRANVLTGAECTRHARDWMGKYQGQPAGGGASGSVAEVAAVCG